jgi:hypothetical protein
MKMVKIIKPLIYLIVAISIIVNGYLWIRIVSMPFSPTEQEVIPRVTITIFIPIILSLLAVLLKRQWLMYTAFIFAVPYGLYFLGGEGTWQLFGSFQIIYLIAAILMTFNSQKLSKKTRSA